MPSKSRSKTSPARVRKARIVRDILALRESGLSISEIHRTLNDRYTRETGRGIGRSTVHKYLQEALDRDEAEIAEEAERLRALQTRRLGQLLRAHWPHALRGHIGSTGRVLQIMDQYNRLHGLYAPTRLEHDHRGTLESLLAPLLAAGGEHGGEDDGE